MSEKEIFTCKITIYGRWWGSRLEAQKNLPTLGTNFNPGTPLAGTNSDRCCPSSSPSTSTTYCPTNPWHGRTSEILQLYKMRTYVDPAHNAFVWPGLGGWWLVGVFDLKPWCHWSQLFWDGWPRYSSRAAYSQRQLQPYCLMTSIAQVPHRLWIPNYFFCVFKPLHNSWPES